MSTSEEQAQVELVETPEQLQAALAIREQVFVLEQSVPAEADRDAYDERAVHLLVRVGGQAVATARLLAGPGKVGRVAVLAPFRGRGLGLLLMEEVHRQARRRQLGQLTLDAQLPVIPFYARLGYVAVGPQFEECGILHRRMTLCLS